MKQKQMKQTQMNANKTEYIGSKKGSKTNWRLDERLRFLTNPDLE